MSNLNRVTLIGKLGKDPEIRYTPGGQAVANISLATNERWTSKEGKAQEATEWHRIVVWGKLAEVCGEHLSKGRTAYFEGKLKTRTWEKDGDKRYTTEVQANQVIFMPDGNGGGGGRQKQQQGQQQAEDLGYDDDVPF